ncbi:arsenate reductase ArsC [Flavobacteriales bacterium AH-315-E23]|nr:arsenate reductase ArsC [Flavobacteriales bacterium AH-315-E23]
MVMKILIVCTGNSCRSQMAEAFFNELDGVEAKSAGTHPEKVNPVAVEVMGELGIDISDNQSNHVDDYTDESFDYVLTVCDHAERNCPVFPGDWHHIHHAFRDPAKAEGTEEEVLCVYREVRDEIKDYLPEFLKNVSV